MSKTLQLDLTIEGMTCASCVSHVERALSKVEGVTSVSVNLATERAQLTLSQAVPVTTFIQKVEDNEINSKACHSCE